MRKREYNLFQKHKLGLQIAQFCLNLSCTQQRHNKWNHKKRATFIANQPVYAVTVYQTPELMRENCAYISKSSQHTATPWRQSEWLSTTYQNLTFLFTPFLGFFFTAKKKIKKSKGDPDAFTRSLLHMKHSGLWNSHRPALFILNRYIRQRARGAHPYEWFILNDSPGWESNNWEERVGTAEQTWICSALQPGLKYSVPPDGVKLYVGWRKWRSWSGGYFRLLSIPSQFHGHICFLLSGGACEHLPPCPSVISLDSPMLRLWMLTLKCRAFTTLLHRNVFEFHVQHTVIYSIHFHEAIKRSGVRWLSDATTRAGFNIHSSFFRFPVLLSSL